MRALVTGGAGYVGSHVAKRLAREGITPVVFDDLRRGHKDAVKWGPFVHADLADREAIARAIREHRIDHVLHFAAYAYVGESMREPGMYFRNNVANSINLLDAMVETGVRSIVLSSTCTAYGEPVDGGTLVEGAVERPVNPYGESKLFVERMLHWYATAHGLRWCALRYFNAAGADPEGELVERHEPETHLVPLAIQAALGKIPALTLYGTDYTTPDGTAIRDYVHVTDLAEAHVRALGRLRDGASGLVYNLGTGRGHSVREIIAAVERVTKRRVPVVEAPRRPGDAPALVASPDRARKELAWDPTRSDLDTIVRTTWDSMRGGRA